jgi:hypothetical protein
MKKIFILMFLVSIFFIFGCATYSPKTTNPAKVSFYFEGNGKSVLTFWRKINSDGTKGQIFSVGGNSNMALVMNMRFKKPYSQTIILDEGTYYLDSYQIANGNGFIISQKGHYTQRNGWDKETNQPLYLSFNVKAGEQLILPKVKLLPKEEGNDFLVKFEFEDPNGIFTVGKKVKGF